MVSARLENAQPHLSECENTPLYALTSRLWRSANSVAVKLYSAQMKSSSTFGDAELQGAMSRTPVADRAGDKIPVMVMLYRNDAAGVGRDGDRIGGVRVVHHWPFGMCRSGRADG